MWGDIDLTQVDGESIIDEPLMVQIKDNLDFLKGKTDGIPSLAWSGLSAAAAIDVNHDIETQPGAARDTTDSGTLILGLAQTKRLDERWISGDAAGGLANAPLFSAQITVSFDNATSKISGVGLFGGVSAGDTIIVAGSPANSGNHEITAASADDATLSIAPTTEAAGSAITVYIVKANWTYNIFLADDGAGGVEIGFDDDIAAVNFLGLAGVGTLYRGIGYVDTDASANISEIVWIGDEYRDRFYPGVVGTTAVVSTWRKPAMLRDVDIELASGGSTGRSNNATGPNSEGGGSSGGYGRKRIKSVDLATTETVTAGQGGVHSATTGYQPGGASSFGAHISATGGTGVAAGLVTGADIAVDGVLGSVWTANNDRGGDGGACPLGNPGMSQGLPTGNHATGYGAGGSGGYTSGTADIVAGSGGPGIVIIREYFK